MSRFHGRAKTYADWVWHSSKIGELWMVTKSSKKPLCNELLLLRVRTWLTLSILLESKIEPELILPNKSALWWVLASSRWVWGCEADSRPVGTTPGRRRQEDASTHWCRGTPNTGPPPLIPSLVLSDMAWRKIKKKWSKLCHRWNGSFWTKLTKKLLQFNNSRQISTENLKTGAIFFEKSKQHLIHLIFPVLFSLILCMNSAEKPEEFWQNKNYQTGSRSQRKTPKKPVQKIITKAISLTFSRPGKNFLEVMSATFGFITGIWKGFGLEIGLGLALGSSFYNQIQKVQLISILTYISSKSSKPFSLNFFSKMS